MTVSYRTEELQNILTLLHDPVFLRFEAEQEAPTIFNAVGRTYTETWHSALLGWLLDPDGSHELGIFPLQRLLLLLSKSAWPEAVSRKVHPAELLSMGELTHATVRPNERALQEVSVAKVGRFDVYVTGLSLAPWSEVRVMIEVKVEASIDKSQCRKYMQYFHGLEAQNVFVLPVFLAPESYFIGSPEDLFGAPEWTPIGFQTLYDEIIEPCIQHFSISQFGKYTLTEYIKTLKYRRKGTPLAVAQSDRELINNLLRNHRPAIDALYEILSQQSPEFDASALSQEGSKTKIKINIDGWAVEATSIAKLYRSVLEHLYHLGKLQTLELPISSGTKRYLLANEPVHPLGNAFVYPVDFKGYFMEANKSRDGGLSDLAKLVSFCGLSMRDES